MAYDELIRLFETARKSGKMDSNTQQSIFRIIAEDWSCIPLNGTKCDEKLNPKAPRPGISWKNCSIEKIEMPDFNTDMMGICTGLANGIIVIDIDTKKFKKFLKKYGYKLPKTLTTRTTWGYHLYYKRPNDGNIYGCKSFGDDGYDIRGDGGYVVSPGSSCPDDGFSGEGYYDIIDFNNGVIADAPQWILDKCIETAATVEEQELENISDQYVTSESSQDFDISKLNEDLKIIDAIESIDLSQSIDAMESSLPPALQQTLTNGKPVGKRSEACIKVVDSLVNKIFSNSNIKQLFIKNNLGERYKEKGDMSLKRDIKSAINFVLKNPPNSNIIDEAEKLAYSFEYFVSDERKFFCRLHLNNCFQYIDVNSNDFFGYLNKELKERFKKRLTNIQFKDFLGRLEFHLNHEIKLENIKTLKRFIQDYDVLIYNTGGKYPEPITITKNGIGITQQSIPLIVKKDLEEAKIDLTANGLENFTEFLNLFQINDNSQRHYLLVHCLSFLFGEISTPILYLYGKAGSGKTTFGSTIRNVFDPHLGKGAPLTGKQEDFITYTSNFDVVFFDNFTSLSDTMQNYLCLSYSGAHNVQRKKYSDNAPVNIVFKSSIILASIDVPRIRQDLLSRIVFLDIDKKENSLPENDIKKQVDTLLPKVRGEIINLASKVLAVIDGIKTNGQSRHADFEKLANAAISVLCNNPEYQTYIERHMPIILDILDMLNSKSILAHGQVLNQVVSLVRARGFIVFRMEELANMIAEQVKGFTGNAASLGKLINRSQDVFDMNDICLSQGIKINGVKFNLAYDKNAANYPYNLDIKELQGDPAAIVKKYLELAVGNQSITS